MNLENQTPIKDGARMWLTRKLKPVLVSLGLVVSFFCVHIPVSAQVATSTCGSHGGGYGPYDYRGADPQKLYLVESAHFTPIVESLIRGSSATVAGADLDYTLRAFPNHPRALLATIKYGEKYKSQNPPGMRYPIECWFIRALQFQPDDYIVRMIYASFLNNQNRPTDAITQLESAEHLSKDNGFTHYNIGLVYFDMKQYDKALKQAHRAIELGFARTDLRDQLVGVGKWKDAPVTSPLAPTN